MSKIESVVTLGGWTKIETKSNKLVFHSAPESYKENKQVHKEIRRDRIPLSSVPLPNERKGKIRQDLKSVAEHELNHALIADKNNISIGTVSAIANGDSLGRTTFNGFLNPETFKVIAAGGSISLSDGTPASGYGYDMHMIDVMQFHYGGGSRNEARSQAQVVISGFDPRIRNYMSEILAFFGEINGNNMLKDIYQRARFEVALESGEEMPEVFFEEEKNLKQKEDKVTVIEKLKSGDCRISYIDKKKTVKEFIICRECFGENSHLEDCPNHINKKLVEDDNKLSEEDIDGKESNDAYPLKKEGIIFLANPLRAA